MAGASTGRGRSTKAGAIALVALVAGTVLSGAAAEAALAPQWQRAREFDRVVDGATKAFDGRPIDAVERVEGSRYRARAGSCVVEIRVIYHPRPDPGPQDFAVSPGRPGCP